MFTLSTWGNLSALVLVLLAVVSLVVAVVWLLADRIEGREQAEAARDGALAPDEDGAAAKVPEGLPKG